MLPLLLIAALGNDKPPKSLTGHVAVQIQNKLFVTGGLTPENNQRPVDQLWQLDVVEGKWTLLPSISEGRSLAAAATLSGRIYVAGGIDKGGRDLDSVEAYDPAELRWRKVAPMTTGRTRFALAQVGGRLYAVGGMTRSLKNLDSIEEYDPIADKWKVVGKLLDARHGFATVVDGHRICIFGGYAGNPMRLSARCEYWDTRTRMPQALPDSPVARGFHGVIVHEGRAVCFGGRQDTKHPSVFTLQGHVWSESPSPDLAINRFVPFVFGNRIAIVGGEGRDDQPLVSRQPVQKLLGG